MYRLFYLAVKRRPGSSFRLRRPTRLSYPNLSKQLPYPIVYLHYGRAVILVFVGAKFVAQGFGLQIPIVASLLVILVAITAAIVASLIATRGGNSRGGDDHPQRER